MENLSVKHVVSHKPSRKSYKHSVLTLKVLEYIRCYTISPILYFSLLFSGVLIIFSIITSSSHHYLDNAYFYYCDFQHQPLLVAVTASISLTVPIFFDICMELLIKNKDQDSLERMIILLSLNCTNFSLILSPPNKSQEFIPSLLFCESFIALGATISLFNKYNSKLFSKRASIFFVMMAFLECILGNISINTGKLYSLEFASRMLIIITLFCFIISHLFHLFQKYYSLQSFKDIMRNLTSSDFKAGVISFALLVEVIGYSLFPFIGTQEENWQGIGKSYVVLIIAVQTIFAMIIAHGMSGEVRMVSVNLSEKLDVKRTFVRYVGHEIRTPLNTAFMGLELIECRLRNLDCEVPADVFDDIEETKASCLTAVDILNDLLNYEKLESGLMILERSTVDPVSFLLETVRPFAMTARNKNIEMDILSNSEGVKERLLVGCNVIDIDEKKISQVVRNFLSNAIKFTPPGGKVTVSIDVNAASFFPKRSPSVIQVVPIEVVDSDDEVPKTLRIRVRDTGHGIAPENQHKVFNEIVQFDAKAQQGGGGSGIGLWISKKIVELHGGRVGLVSEGKGKGCEFFFELPLVPNMVAVQAIASESKIDSPLVSLVSRKSMRSEIAQKRSTFSSTNERVVILDDETSSVRPLSDTAKQISGRYEALKLLERQSGLIHQHSMMINVQSSSNSSTKEPDKRKRAMSDLMQSAMKGIKDPILEDSERQSRECHSSVVQEIELPSRNRTSSVVQEIELPLRARAEMSDQPQLKKSSGSVPTGLRILVVDDSALTRKMASKLLSTINCVCTEADDGLDAFNLVESDLSKFDVVLIDNLMPNLCGPPATKKMRDAGYRGIVIGATGNAQPEDIKEYLDHGANKVLVKPISVQAFKSAYCDCVKQLQKNADDAEILSL